MTALDPAFLRLPLAHRALHDLRAGRPENSCAAIRAAVDAGYGIEIDVQVSSDGVAMVFHDDDLDRLTDATGPVRARSAAGLGGIPLKGSDEGIPTLAEVLALVAGRVPLLIEVKDQHGQMGPVDGVLEQAVARDLMGYSGPVAVMSFNPHSVIALRNAAPNVPRGLVSGAFRPEDCPELPENMRARLRGIPDYAEAGACFISHRWDDLDRPRVRDLAAAGAAILCWTIRSRQSEAAARRVAANITFEGYLPDLQP
ncbi:glycerophosphodiester phosphodiesterase family protein [Roseovarius sp. M141]|uniref:glycerophosphodiester phosphodiesterase family protein n=1 Tax=Roseovarius sp. M141 TaxID=2583806 RepID=UPI0020CBAC73|nr:glycerophosphodiester phosphodiesterase family protein [Roseovarius sp. M141]MCQ0091130.1 phosphodiesterase [Roseovarius sp. M141]